MKAFIFDWSGTLSDNVYSFKQVCDLIFKKFGRKLISVEEIRQTFTIPYMKFWNKYLPELSIQEQDRLYRKYIHEVDDPELYKGVTEIIN